MTFIQGAVNVNISGDNPNLVFAPLFESAVKTKMLSPKRELEKNKARLIEVKEQMKFMKDRIKKFVVVLKREVGEETDIKELLRQGGTCGWQARAQTIMTLRIKLIAMRTKFLDPPHKMYYRGPFDPKKEFELKCLPQKQDNLYERMLAEKKKKILQLDKPVAALKTELDELSLMHRAARFRTKNLKLKVKNASQELEKSEEKAKFNLRTIEAMMAHQSLFKMMIEPETLRLDTELKRHVKHDPLRVIEVEDWKKFKMLLDKTQKQANALREALFSVTAELDEINKNLIESKKVDIEARLCFAAQGTTEISSKDKKGKDKAKEETDTESKYKVLVQENQRLRQFLLNSVLMSEQDFKLFVNGIDCAKQEFLEAIENVKFGNLESE